MIWLLRELRLLQAAFCAKDSPRQMAAGLACGLLLGLIPKGNLLAILVASMLLATRMSLATGIAAALCISLVAPWCDPVTHRLGYGVLTFPPLQSVWRSLARLPLAPWTSFNNTVVMGSLLLGTLLMYPTYRISLPWMVWLHRRRPLEQPPPAELETAAAELQTLPIGVAHAASPPMTAQQVTATPPPPPRVVPRRTRPARAPSTAHRMDRQSGGECRPMESPRSGGLEDPRRSCA